MLKGLAAAAAAVGMAKPKIEVCVGLGTLYV